MPTVTHITDRPIANWSDWSFQLVGQRRIEERGKPSGLWYAYGKSWYDFYYKPAFNKGKKTCDILYKYSFEIPTRSFTQDVQVKGKDKILVLTPANVGAFVDLYGLREKGVYTRFYELLKEDVQEGAGNFEDLLTNTGFKHRKLLEDVFAWIEEGGEEDEDDEEGEDEDESDESDEEENDENEGDTNRGNSFARLLNKGGGEAAVREILDAIGKGESSISWPSFWDSVRERIGGVEFSAEFFEGRVELPAAVAWIPPLVELRSGVIFKPRTFFKMFDICPKMTHVLCKKDRKRLKTRKGKARRELLKRLLTRKGMRKPARAPACD